MAEGSGPLKQHSAGRSDEQATNRIAQISAAMASEGAGATMVRALR